MAQEPTTLFELSSLTQYNKCEATTAKMGDCYWSWSSYGPCAQLYSYSYSYYEDYLTLPAIDMTAGTLYKIEVSATKYNSYDQNIPLTFLLGTGDAPTDPLNELVGWTQIAKMPSLEYFYNYQAADFLETFTFSVETDGAYRLSIYGTKPCKVFTFRLISMGESDVPQAVNDLAVQPATNGSASAEISFTLPNLSISNKQLDGRMSYTISCGDEPVKGGSDAPGAFITWTHNPAPLGDVTYSVVVSQGENVSEAASVSTYVGLETPTAVTNATLASAGSTHTVRWQAPAVGTHGAALDPSALSYTLTRILDGERTVATTEPLVGVTEFVDTFEPVGLQKLSYEVVVSLGENSADAVATPEVVIGSVDLPFINSFVDAANSMMWSTQVVEGLETENWIFAATSPKSPITGSYDNDGALAYYNCFDISSGKSARLITAPISRASTLNPLLQFYIYHHSSGNDVLKIQLSIDGGEWVDVPEASWTLKNDVNGQWVKHTAAFGDLLPEDCTSYRVSFTGVSAYGFCMSIDAVSIVNLLDKDLALTGFNAPESHIVGNTLALTFNVTNNSTSEVEAGAYTLHLDTDYPDEVVMPEPVAVAGLSSVPMTIEMPIHSLHAYEAGFYSFKVSLDLEGDEDTSNNTTDQLSVNLAYSTGTSASDLALSRNDDGSQMLLWTPAIDIDYVPVNIDESFEDVESGTTDDINGWTVIDLDQRSATYYNTNSSKLTVVAPTSVPSSGRDGSKVVGCAFPSYVQQDDWLISPAMSLKDGVTLDLSFLIAVRSKTSLSYSNKYAFEVLYATEDFNPEAPAEAFTHELYKKDVTSTYDNTVSVREEKFTTISVTGIPSEAKYVAIHLCSKLTSDGATWLDKIVLTEHDPMQLQGYNVYQIDGGRLNEELLPATATEFALATPEVATFANTLKRYFVTAVYPDGEAAPSNIAEDVDTGVENVADSDIVIAAVDGGVSVSSPAAVAVTVSDLAGRTVAAFTAEGTTTVALPQGIYLVRAAAASAKLIVR